MLSQNCYSHSSRSLRSSHRAVALWDHAKPRSARHAKQRRCATALPCAAGIAVLIYCLFCSPYCVMAVIDGLHMHFNSTQFWDLKVIAFIRMRAVSNEGSVAVEEKPSAARLVELKVTLAHTSCAAAFSVRSAISNFICRILLWRLQSLQNEHWYMSKLLCC